MKKNDLLFSVVSIIFGVIVILFSKDMPRGASIFPIMVGIMVIILGVILFVATYKKEVVIETTTAATKLPYVHLAAFAGLLLIYYFVMPMLGYIISTTLLIFLTTVLANYKNYKVSIITSFAISLVMFLIFSKLFMVYLPSIVV